MAVTYQRRGHRWLFEPLLLSLLLNVCFGFVAAAETLESKLEKSVSEAVEEPHFPSEPDLSDDRSRSSAATMMTVVRRLKRPSPSFEQLTLRAEAALRCFQRDAPEASTEKALAIYLRLSRQLHSRILINERRGLPKATINVSPPSWGDGVVFAGMCPDGVENLALRAQYEEAIASNGRATRFLVWHSGLRRLETSIVAAFVIAANNLNLDREQITAAIASSSKSDEEADFLHVLVRSAGGEALSRER